MASVLVFTAQRMLEIENQSIVDGNVVGSNLILVKKNGEQINAGNVRGPQGPTGTTGGIADAPEDNDSYVRKDGNWTKLANDILKPQHISDQVDWSGSGSDVFPITHNLAARPFPRLAWASLVLSLTGAVSSSFRVSLETKVGTANRMNAGSVSHIHTGASTRRHYVIPGTRIISVPAGEKLQVRIHIFRFDGSSTVTRDRNETSVLNIHTEPDWGKI